jgi:hypothetical protein
VALIVRNEMVCTPFAIAFILYTENEYHVLFYVLPFLLRPFVLRLLALKTVANVGQSLNFVVFWDVTQRRLVSHRPFGTTCRSHLQISRCPKTRTSWSFKTGQIHCPETSVRNQPTLSNISEDYRIQVNQSRSLRSFIHNFLIFSLWFLVKGP